MSKPICLIGDIFIDVTIGGIDSPTKMRLGGIVHSARALWAMNVPYSVAYFAPDYLDFHIKNYLLQHGCVSIIKLGNVPNAPYVMLIKEVKEIGDQGYESLLRDHISIELNSSELDKLNSFSTFFLISGSYNLNDVLKKLPAESKIYIDIANEFDNISSLECTVDTIFISTSSLIFSNFIIKNDFFEILNFLYEFKDYSKRIILKENRGGSRAFDFSTSDFFSIPAQTQPINHSVGVGDVYDVVFVALDTQFNLDDALYYSSWIACEYAKTTFPNDFKIMVERIMKLNVSELKSLKGCLLPWEKRSLCHIYIAAPDFDFVDTKCIDILCNSLRYHNFCPHRPILENGQMTIDADLIEKSELYVKDMQLLDSCNMLLAVLLYNDPGTLIEIGIAAERKMPVIVYDPYKIAKNCMLTQVPNIISSNLDTIISNVFKLYSKN